MLQISVSKAAAGEAFLQEDSDMWLKKADVSSAVLSSCHWLWEMSVGGQCVFCSCTVKIYLKTHKDIVYPWLLCCWDYCLVLMLQKWSLRCNDVLKRLSGSRSAPTVSEMGIKQDQKRKHGKLKEASEWDAAITVLYKDVIESGESHG